MIIAIASILLLMLIAWVVLWALNYWHVCEVDDDFAGATVFATLVFSVFAYANWQNVFVEWDTIKRFRTYPVMQVNQSTSKETRLVGKMVQTFENKNVSFLYKKDGQWFPKVVNIDLESLRIEQYDGSPEIAVTEYAPDDTFWNNWVVIGRSRSTYSYIIRMKIE